MATIDDVRSILGSVLGVGPRAAEFRADTRLLGAIPELDSMAVVNLLTALEEQFGISVDDDEVSADTFSTLATLSEFVEGKLAALS